MNTLRKFVVVAILLGLLAAMIPAQAQDDMTAPPVLILPVDRAQFLPGALFDLRIEVHAEELPGDFAVTVNGEAAADFFGSEGDADSWRFDVPGEAADDPNAGTPSNALTWRNLSLDEPGMYTVEVTAGGETHTANWTVREPQNDGGRNVILFIADGGSVPIFTATRLLSRGIQEGTYNGYLSFEEFEEFGLLSTSGVDSIMTDSANSASAFNTGHKSSVNATGVYADTSADAYDDPRVETFAELVKRVRGMSVGIVTSAYMQDATPAAVFGHSRERNSRSRSDFMQQAIGDENALGNPFTPVMPDIWLGGGARYILPQSVEGSRRPDNVDAFALYEENGYTIVTTEEELNTAVGEGSAPILGVFANNNIDTWLDRNVYTENLESETQPGLVEMTMAALDVLSQNENGFYLEVEAASIDKQLHPMDFERALADSIEFERTIAATVQYLEENGLAEDTLIIVSADHGHSFDVFGTVDTEAFNAADNDIDRRNSIGVYADAGYPTYVDEDGDFFPDNWDTAITLAWGKVENPPFTEDYQVSPVPRNPSVTDENGVAVDNPDDDPNGLALGGNLPGPATSSVHTLQDVPVYAQGPGSQHLGRVQENIEVFFTMASAIGLDPREGMMGDE